MSPNQAYGGPHAKTVSKYSSVPFTSDTAEDNAILAGSLDVGYVPLANLPHINKIRSIGYNVFGYPAFGWLYVVYNFKDATGHFNKIISQLYIRQAMAHLQDQPDVIKAFFYGAAAQAYGPVPVLPKSPYTPANALINPYPFSVTAATSLLKAHGWKVVPGGTDTCTRPGSGSSDCGAGIPAGTPLAWNLIYTTTPASIGEQVTSLASEARRAGIEITLVSSNFNYIVANYDDQAGKANIDKWAMADFGGFADETYPTTFGIFNCAGSSNFGGYCSLQADKLIDASVSITNPSAVTNPAATSSHKAVSISAFSLPLPRTMSAKKEAPRCRKKSRTSCALWLSPRPVFSASEIGCSLSRRFCETCGFSRGIIQSASSRTKKVIGATLVGITRR